MLPLLGGITSLPGRLLRLEASEWLRKSAVLWRKVGLYLLSLSPIIPEQALSPASSQRVQNAQRGEDTSVLPQSCLPLARCLVSSTSGLWAPVWELPPGRGQPLGGQPPAACPQSPAHVGVAAGARAAQSMPRCHGRRLRVAGSKEQPFCSSHERHLQGTPGPALRKLAELREGWGSHGLTASPLAPGRSPTRAAVAPGNPGCRHGARGGRVRGRPSLLAPVPQARGLSEVLPPG